MRGTCTLRLHPQRGWAFGCSRSGKCSQSRTSATRPYGRGCAKGCSRVLAWLGGSRCGARTRSKRGWARYRSASSKGTRWIPATRRTERRYTPKAGGSMSAHSRPKSFRRRNTIPGQFAWRLVEMLESPAYRALTLSAHRILARFEIELAHHGSFDNGKLTVTFEDFEQYGMDGHAVAPAIRECCALGFLEVTEVGRAGNAEFRRPSKYRLTYRHVDRADPTNEWQRIHTVEEAEQIARAARRSAADASRKRKTSGGKCQVSVGGTHTEKAKAPMGKTPITVLSGGKHHYSRYLG